MSTPCETSDSFVLHSVVIPVGEVSVHPPAARPDRNGKREASDVPIFPASGCAPYFTVKSAVDRIITATLMVIALPIMALVGLAILLIDGRPVFYRQTRVGRRGRVFWIWKFRTMRRDAESETGAVWSSERDPRVTSLGRWLRCAHLDELPQFFNVLAGDMNLIGPRPERPEFLRELMAEVPRYVERLSVRPGITGLAQLRFGYDQSLADVKRKALLDAKYVRGANLILDLRILLFTLPYVAGQVVCKWKAGGKALHSEVSPSRGDRNRAPGRLARPARPVAPSHAR